MVTKKYIKRMIKFFNTIRGPIADVDKHNSIDPFLIFLINSSGDKHMYSKFHAEVLSPNKYYSKEMLNGAIKFVNENIPIID